MQQWSSEPVAELAERVTSGIRRGLGVDLHRDGDLAMPQDAHRHTRVDVERGQQRGTGLAGAMDGDPGYPGGGDAAVKAAIEVARLDRGAAPCGEDQTGVYQGGPDGAARAADAARTPSLPLPLPLRRRLVPVGWRESETGRGR